MQKYHVTSFQRTYRSETGNTDFRTSIPIPIPKFRWGQYQYQYQYWALAQGQYQYQYQYWAMARGQYQYQYQYSHLAWGQYQYQYQYWPKLQYLNTNTNTFDGFYNIALANWRPFHQIWMKKPNYSPIVKIDTCERGFGAIFVLWNWSRYCRDSGSIPIPIPGDCRNLILIPIPESCWWSIPIPIPGKSGFQYQYQYQYRPKHQYLNTNTRYCRSLLHMPDFF